jgi:serine/threonine-protein kinase
MSRPSAPVPSPPVIGMPGGPRIQSVTSTSVPPAPANRTPLILALMVAVGLGLALFFVLRPTTGGLVVTVAGPGNKPVEGVEVLVDSKVACKASPCTLADLPAGTHLVQARAKGYSPTAEIAVLVTGGQDAVHNIPLAKAAGTGLRVTGTGAGLRVFVDGKDYGPLPQELSELSAGMHTLKVSGEQFETWEKSVTVVDEEMQTIDVPKLKVLKGLAIIKAGDNASGARVLLESDGDRRVLPSLPMNLHIDTTKPHKLVATRKGFETYRQDLVFEDGEAERTFEVELAPQGDDSDGSPSQVNQRRSSRSSTSRGSSSSGSSSSEASSGNGTLNINSIPASNVLLDGRPIGKTPRLGVSVSAGSHTVIFVYEGNRQVKSVTATAGKTSTVVHRFK